MHAKRIEGHMNLSEVIKRKRTNKLTTYSHYIKGFFELFKER